MPQKRVRDDEANLGEHAAVDAASVVNVNYIKSASSGQILSRLRDMSNAMERVTAVRSTSVEKLVSKAFLEEITKSEYVNHPSGDVQCLVAIILAECYRLRPELDLPGKKTAGDFLGLIAQVLGASSSGGKGRKVVAAGNEVNRRHLVESLAAGRALHHVVKQAKGADTEDLVSSVTERLLFSGDAVDDSQVASFAAVISDTITAHQTINSSQFSNLLAAVGAPPKGVTPSASVVSKHIAGHVFRKSEDVFHDLIAEYVSDGLVVAVDTFRKIEIADGEASEKRQALLDLNRIVEVIPAVAVISSNLGLRLFPNIQKYLVEDDNDVRLAVTKAFSSAFVNAPRLKSDYPAIYRVFLNRVADVRPTIRTFTLKSLQTIITQPQSPESWNELAQLIHRTLSDSDETIRRQAIEATCELAAAQPVRFIGMFPKGGELGARCHDKKVTVRRVAIQSLTSLFLKIRASEATLKTLTKEQLAWIPCQILQSGRLPGTVQFVEESLERLMSVRPGASTTTTSTTTTAGGGGAASPSGRKGTKGGAAGSTTSKKTAGRSAGKAATADSNAVFDFEQDTSSAHTTFGGLNFVDINSNIPSAVAFLCELLDKDNLDVVLTLGAKKNQLRGVVAKMLDLRGQVKELLANQDPQAPVVVEQINRLLQFLSTMTHSADSWNNLFKLKDLKPIKALDYLCCTDCDDYVKGSQDCLTTFKGRVDEKLYRFMEENLILRLSFPVSKKDIEELVKIIERKRTAVSGNTSAAFVAYVRAFRVLTSAVPLFISPHVVKLVKWIGEDANAVNGAKLGGEKEKENHVHFIQAFSEELMVLSQANPEHSKISESDKKKVIETIGRICLTSSSGPTAKTAARCMCRLFKSDTKAFLQLTTAIAGLLTVAAEGTATNLPDTVVAHLRTLEVFIKEAPAAARQEIRPLLDRIMEDAESILLAAVRTSTAHDTIAAKSKAVKAAGGIQNYRTPMGDVTAACAKLITTYAKHAPATVKNSAIEGGFKALISAFKGTAEVGTETAGACVRRLALDKQLVQLLVMDNLGGSDPSTAVVAMVFLSCENNNEVRAAVQEKMKNHIVKNRAGCALFALLLLTSFSEETRAQYNALKSLVHESAEAMRSRIGETKLDDVAAPNVYLEFALPYLISFLSHHSFFEDEKDNCNFSGFQRIFILFFEELFRNDNDAASFVNALLTSIKKHDDVLNPDESFTREIADLTFRVMHDVLSQKSVSVDQVKVFPGRVMIPQMLFRLPKDPSRFPSDKIYLAKSITLIHQPQFKQVLPSQTPAGKSLGRLGASVSPAPSNAMDGQDLFAGGAAYDAAGDEEAPASKRARHEDAGALTGALTSKTSPKKSTTTANKKAGGSTGKKGNNKKKKQQEQEEEEVGKTNEEIITDVINELTDGLTFSQIKKLSWTSTEAHIKEALAIVAPGPLPDDLREAARDAVAAALAGVAE